jgi:ArsR family transcriptional regulator
MERLLSALKATAEPTRLRLLALCAEGELTVSELTAILGQSQPRVSRHLRLLCEAGLLERFREGNWIFHRLARESVNADLVRRLLALIPQDDPNIELDRERLRAVRRARAERAAAYFRKNAPEWDEIRSLHVPESEVERALVEVVSDAGPRELLDVGTGTGRILEILAPLVEHGLGVDISSEMLAIARAKLGDKAITNCELRLADMYKLPVVSASVDAVTIHQVLHFADEPAAVIAEAARVLRPGGRLIVIDFAPHELEELRADHAHRRLGFGDAEVRGWFQKAGLNPASTTVLEGDPLTVVVWPAERASAPEQPRETVRAPTGDTPQ